jgi:Spy/CpxP family protein refolding chaperone
MNRIATVLTKSAVFVLCALTLAPNAVRAQDPAAEQRSDPMAIYREAGAGKEEQHKILAYVKEFEATQRVKAERITNMLKRMNEVSLEADPDEKMVLSLQDEINSTQAEMANARVKLLLNIRATLTAEHKVRLVDLMKQRRARAGGGAGSMSMMEMRRP